MFQQAEPTDCLYTGNVMVRIEGVGDVDITIQTKNGTSTIIL